ncbi:MAG TPA: TlpA disulfide reductase family protein [Anaerolineales bacterium]|nr:TlpA disulfide reductase family protein [Anaerolineales bacterium]
MEKKNTWLAIILISIIGICLIGCLGIGLAFRLAPNIYQYELESSSLKVGDAAPDFELISLDGEIVRLSQFKGQPILLSIGATWCPDCRKEAPLLQKLHENHPELIVLLIDSKEGTDVVQDFAEEFSITHPILLDSDGAVSKLYQVFAIPTELFIDADGIIQAKIIESVTTELLAEKLPLIGVDP